MKSFKRYLKEDWWDDLGPEGQAQYISDHPNSAKAKTARAEKEKENKTSSDNKGEVSQQPIRKKPIKLKKPELGMSYGEIGRQFQKLKTKEDCDKLYSKAWHYCETQKNKYPEGSDTRHKWASLIGDYWMQWEKIKDKLPSEKDIQKPENKTPATGLDKLKNQMDKSLSRKLKTLARKQDRGDWDADDYEYELETAIVGYYPDYVKELKPELEKKYGIKIKDGDFGEDTDMPFSYGEGISSHYGSYETIDDVMDIMRQEAIEQLKSNNEEAAEKIEDDEESDNDDWVF